MRTPMRRDAPAGHPDHTAQALAEDITQQFDDWRQARGMSYSELGRAAGSSPHYGNHLLMRPRNLTLTTICRFAHALGLDVVIKLKPRAGRVAA